MKIFKYMKTRNYLQDTSGRTNPTAVAYLTGLLNKRAETTSGRSLFSDLKLIALSFMNAGSFFFY
jgi:hypothetical protein